MNLDRWARENRCHSHSWEVGGGGGGIYVFLPYVGM